MYTDDTFLLDGKYKFTKLCRVPPDYLLKVHKDGGLSSAETAKVREYVNNNLEKIIMRKEGILPIPLLDIPCAKIVYATDSIAKRVLKHISEIEQKHKKPIRTYNCKECGGWHLTSMPIEEYERSV